MTSMKRPDIDWLAVEMVCNGTPLKLTTDERRMVMRRLDEKMIKSSSPYAVGLSAEEVGRRLGVTSRSVERFQAQLPPADKRKCPVCGQTMWVIGAEVEAHPDALFNECPMSYSLTRKGLAAIRPDLYRWVEEVPA